MAYITKEEIAALPEDPEEAFIELEAIVRQRFQEALDNLSEQDSELPLYHRYMSAVLPAAQHYLIAGAGTWERPANLDQYSQLMTDIDYCVTEIKLKIVARVKRHSVALDGATKSKLRRLLDEVRQTVDKLDDPIKKDRLYSRINALQEEIERERTKFEALGDLFIVACQYVAEGAKELEPAVRLVERIGAAIGVAKQAEDARPRLPPPPKRIAQQRHPEQDAARRKPNRTSISFDKKTDDEIPF